MIYWQSAKWKSGIHRSENSKAVFIIWHSWPLFFPAASPKSTKSSSTSKTTGNQSSAKQNRVIPSIPRHQVWPGWVLKVWITFHDQIWCKYFLRDTQMCNIFKIAIRIMSQFLWKWWCPAAFVDREEPKISYTITKERNQMMHKTV